MWNSKSSNLLQVLISIQGLIAHFHGYLFVHLLLCVCVPVKLGLSPTVSYISHQWHREGVLPVYCSCDPVLLKHSASGMFTSEPSNEGMQSRK